MDVPAPSISGRRLHTVGEYLRISRWPADCQYKAQQVSNEVKSQGCPILEHPLILISRRISPSSGLSGGLLLAMNEENCHAQERGHREASPDYYCNGISGLGYLIRSSRTYSSDQRYILVLDIHSRITACATCRICGVHGICRGVRTLRSCTGYLTQRFLIISAFGYFEYIFRYVAYRLLKILLISYAVYYLITAFSARPRKSLRIYQLFQHRFLICDRGCFELHHGYISDCFLRFPTTLFGFPLAGSTTMARIWNFMALSLSFWIFHYHTNSCTFRNKNGFIIF